MISKESIITDLKIGCKEIILQNELIEKIKNNKPLIIKAGFDPTSPDLHLGHFILLNKLHKLQIYGYTITIVIGDFTAMIGDPSGKNIMRIPLDKDAIVYNMNTYTEQILKILDKQKTKIVFNSSWLNNLNISELIQLSSKYTVAKMLNREDFNKRYNNNKPIAIHEFLYPLIQGYDSVILKSDIELGGIDQKFNLLIGRDLQKKFGYIPQSIIMTPLIIGLDGKQKMSKSLNNYIGINESADIIFGKIMSISDSLMFEYIDLFGMQSKNDIILMKKKIKNKIINPRDIKINLAKKIVEKIHSTKQADLAYKYFIERFQYKNIPDSLHEKIVYCKNYILVTQLLKNIQLTKSTSESIRLIKQGAVNINNIKITNIKEKIYTKSKYIVQVGKHRIAKIILKEL